MVTAHDFVYSFSRLTDTEVVSPEHGDEQCAIYEALNDSTLMMTLKTPFLPFLGLLSMPYCSVVPEEVVSQTSFRDASRNRPFSFSVLKDNVKLVVKIPIG